MLQPAYYEITFAEQRDLEDGLLYTERITDASHVCRHMFQPTKLVKAYVRGFHEAMRDKIQKQVRLLPEKETVSIFEGCSLIDNPDWPKQDKKELSNYLTVQHLDLYCKICIFF